MEQLVDRRPIAIISKQPGSQNRYEQSLDDNWLAAWTAAAQKNGREFDVINPDKTSSKTLRSRLSSGTYGIVVFGQSELDYYRNMRLSRAARESFRLVYGVRPFNLVDEVVPFILDIDHTIKLW